MAKEEYKASEKKFKRRMRNQLDQGVSETEDPAQKPPESSGRLKSRSSSRLREERPRLRLQHTTFTRLHFTQTEMMREIPSHAPDTEHRLDTVRFRLRFEHSQLREVSATDSHSRQTFHRFRSEAQKHRLNFEAPPLREGGDGFESNEEPFSEQDTHGETTVPDGELPKSGKRLKFEKSRPFSKGLEKFGYKTTRIFEDEFNRVADESDNESVQARNKERQLGVKGSKTGWKFGRRAGDHWYKNQSQRQLNRQNKELIRDTQERAYQLRHGKASPAAQRRKKQMIRKQQLKAAAEKKFGKEAVQKTEQIMVVVAEKVVAVIRAIIAYVGAPVLGMILLFALIIVAMLMIFSAFTNSATVVMSAYTASDADIEASSVYMTELEAKLDKEIKDIPTDWRWQHIDEFRYDLDPIEHDPFQLMSYLNVKFPGFQFWEVMPEIQSIFDERYELILDEEWEWRGTRPDRYKYYILNVTLRAKPLEPVLLHRLYSDPTPQLDEWYDVLIQTEGARQSYANPFDGDWKERVTSLYGYRVDPVGGVNLQMHRGIDIAMPGGTPIKAGLNGTVRYAGYDSMLGNYIILTDLETDRTIKYAHCDSLRLESGDDVIAGETIIGTVGSTGNSTGNHVHIEIQEKGAYLNPIYALTSRIGGET